MATIKGLLALFFKSSTPPTPTFVQFTATAPYVEWQASPPVVGWSASPPSGG